MKTNIIFLLTFGFVCLTSFGKREQADIELILNTYQNNNPHIIVDDSGLWNQMPRSKEVSLRKAQSQGLELDSIESVLLTVFDDVIINGAVPNAYFLTYSDLVGIARLNGAIVVPPVTGKPRKIDAIGGLRIGDIVSYNQIEDYFMKRVGKHKFGYAGIMSAVLDEKSLDPIIPFGVYDYILYTAPTSSSYYVAQKQLDDNGEISLKWGYLDENGNELLPCVFKAVIADENGNLIGSNDVDMLEHMAQLDILRANFSTAEYAEFAPQNFNLSRSQRFWIGVANKLEPISKININKVGDFFTSIAEKIIVLDESLSNNGVYEAIQNFRMVDEEVFDTPNNNNSVSSERDSESGSLSGNQVYNSDKRTYNNYDSMLSQYYAGNRNATFSEVSQWKQKMRQLREKWENRGKSFPHSKNEDK